MNRLVGLLSTSIGQKLVLAISGLALVGFLLVHMLGNLTIFQGPEVMNAYAAWLKGHPLLWAARAGLIGLFLDASGRHDVYKMVVQSFQVPIVAISYLVAMVILGLHLAHGLGSLLQTFGLFHETYTGLIRIGCITAAGLIVIGNASIPLSIWFGLISL